MIFSLFFSLFVSASVTVHQVDNYKPYFDKIRSLSTESSLLVYDIDDTLIHTPDCTIDGVLYTGFRKLFKCPSLKTHPKIQKKIVQFQKAGHDTIALTARGAFMMRKTFVELNRHKIVFEGHPYTMDDNLVLQIPHVRDPSKFTKVHFENGVMFAQGKKKGELLVRLLAELEVKYKNIVFIDDCYPNIKTMTAAYESDSDTHVDIFHYTEYVEREKCLPKE